VKYSLLVRSENLLLLTNDSFLLVYPLYAIVIFKKVKKKIQENLEKSERFHAHVFSHLMYTLKELVVKFTVILE